MPKVITNKASELRVHLDHHIRRLSIRYFTEADKTSSFRNTSRGSQEDTSLRYDDIRRDDWFGRIRKPDFQRETNAWTPDDCAEFLDSVVNGRIIPSIILWRNEENNLTYVLDGAHRLSVIRAWMIDDWGNKSGEYYDRREKNDIIEIAKKTREIVGRRVGHFKDFLAAYEESEIIVNEGGAPKQKMVPGKFNQSAFYGRVVTGFQTLPLQWERGDYDSAEQSFLRINRRGQALDTWEATLIEFRQSSYARCTMSIANGGESGHYWPDTGIEKNLLERLNTFSEKAAKIHKVLFVPPFSQPVTNINVPMMVAPAYFQKHKYLLEVIPLIVWREIAISEEQQIKLMKADLKADASEVIRNADKILSILDERLEHFITANHNSKSLSIVPLFYWYNQKAQYARGLLYGFIYWLFAGTDEDITNRKLVFSANRDRFEKILFILKSEIATLQESGGAGLHSTKKAATFFQDFLSLLQRKPELSGDSEELTSEVLGILRERGRITSRAKKEKSSRAYSRRDKSQINTREIFDSAIRCHICGGIVNLQYGGTQYDHVDDFALSRVTDPETGKPTHPFCNRYKKQIQTYKSGVEKISLVPFIVATDKKKEESRDQFSFFTFWGVPDFPQ